MEELKLAIDEWLGHYIEMRDKHGDHVQEQIDMLNEFKQMIK